MGVEDDRLMSEPAVFEADDIVNDGRPIVLLGRQAKGQDEQRIVGVEAAQNVVAAFVHVDGEATELRRTAL
jgi:hypothetical protein